MNGEEVEEQEIRTVELKLVKGFKDIAIFLSFKAKPWIATKSGLAIPTRLFIQH
ncbi:hypothetical protein SESBI_44598 [Sesbania bispinosa]|nr:hypothetical protein SESBI_44598 [Sesbania bispinosa]